MSLLLFQYLSYGLTAFSICFNAKLCLLHSPGRHKLISTINKEEPHKSKLADKANDHRADQTETTGTELSTVDEEKENVSVP